MTISAVHHIAVICSDYAKSLAFYRDVLGNGAGGRRFFVTFRRVVRSQGVTA